MHASTITSEAANAFPCITLPYSMMYVHTSCQQKPPPCPDRAGLTRSLASPLVQRRSGSATRCRRPPASSWWLNCASAAGRWCVPTAVRPWCPWWCAPDSQPLLRSAEGRYSRRGGVCLWCVLQTPGRAPGWLRYVRYSRKGSHSGLASVRIPLVS